MTLGQESQFDQCGSQPAVLFRLFHCHAAHWGAFLPIAPFLPLAARYRLLNLYNYFLMVWFRIACGVRYEIQGRENIPSGPCVIQANHQCEWETLFLQVMKPPVCTVLKRELLRIPVFGWGCACYARSVWIAPSPREP